MEEDLIAELGQLIVDPTSLGQDAYRCDALFMLAQRHKESRIDQQFFFELSTPLHPLTHLLAVQLVASLGQLDRQVEIL